MNAAALGVVMLGGASGALCRFLLSSWISQYISRSFPWGILVVNILGSFLIGFFTIFLTEKLGHASLLWQFAILIGFLGGFTTFSSFSLDTVTLFQAKAYGAALGNIFASVILCLFGTSIGIIVGRVVATNH